MSGKDLDFSEMPMPDQLRMLHCLPISDDLKRNIEEMLKHDKKALEEIKRLGILNMSRSREEK